MPHHEKKAPLGKQEHHDEPHSCCQGKKWAQLDKWPQRSTWKGWRGGYNGQSQHRGKEGAETPDTGGKSKNCLPSGSIWGQKKERKAQLLTNSNLPDRLPHSSSWKLWTVRVLFFSCLTLPLLLFLALSILPSGFLRGARSNERGRSANRVLACWLHQPVFA